MIVSLGSEIIGHDGSIGKVKRFIIDRKSRRAEEVTVHHVLGGERIISLFTVERVEGHKAFVSLDKSAVQHAEEFSEQAYRAPGLNPDMTPNWQNDMGFRTPDLEGQYGDLESLVQSEPESPAPGREATTPEDQRAATVSHDTVIYDRTGEVVGHVGDFAVQAETGSPVQLALRTGVLFHGKEDIPIELISDYGNERIILQADKQQLEP